MNISLTVEEMKLLEDRYSVNDGTGLSLNYE
jgi:hypothetical protein